jgi:glutathione synthase/RimK-type ligase-like ATP-grasp enzyme
VAGQRAEADGEGLRLGVTVIFATCRHKPGLTPSDELVAAHLRARHIMVTVAPWDSIAPAHLGDAVVCLRSTWDYHTRVDEFRAWIAALGEHRVTVINPVETLLWNMDKEYLGWLEARGISIPETRWIAPRSSDDVHALLREAGWERAVLKPRVSATAYGTHLVGAGTVLHDDQLSALGTSGALLQAFVPEIQSGGEMSLVFIDGSFSHAVRKQPSPGDFRVQREFGGTATPTTATGALRDFGSRVLAAIPVPWTYARVDVVDTHRGPVLMELELIEPDLFFIAASEGARRLAAVLGTMEAS